MYTVTFEKGFDSHNDIDHFVRSRRQTYLYGLFYMRIDQLDIIRLLYQRSRHNLGIQRLLYRRQREADMCSLRKQCYLPSRIKIRNDQGDFTRCAVKSRDEDAAEHKFQTALCIKFKPLQTARIFGLENPLATHVLRIHFDNTVYYRCQPVA